MYKSQTRKSHVLECVGVALIPTLVIELSMLAIFAYVCRTEGIPFSPDLTFMAGVGILTLVVSCAAAASDYLEGPGMVPMSPEEEAAKRAEIEADVLARMSGYGWTDCRPGNDTDCYRGTCGHTLEDRVFENPYA
jgi:hypothetical protein